MKLLCNGMSSASPSSASSLDHPWYDEVAIAVQATRVSSFLLVTHGLTSATRQWALSRAANPVFPVCFLSYSNFPKVSNQRRVAIIGQSWCNSSLNRQIDAHTLPIDTVYQRFSTSLIIGLESPISVSVKVIRIMRSPMAGQREKKAQQVRRFDSQTSQVNVPRL